MSDVGRLLDVARAELGTYENPKGSNHTPYGAWYGMDPAAWCAMFVSWCADRSGCDDVIPRHSYTPDGVDWFRRNGLWVTGGYRPGDIVYFEWPDVGRVSHVGIVEAVNGGTVTTLEGNTHSSGQSSHEDRVMRQYRTAYIVGAGRPDYDQGTEEQAMASYYVEAKQNTGQLIDARPGEDIRLQVDVKDPMRWHNEADMPASFRPDRPIDFNANATCYVDGAAVVHLRTYSGDGTTKMDTIARQDTPTGGGHVSLSGYGTISAGQRLRLYVEPADGDVTVRYAVLAMAARDA